jgi:carboxymethylenebutenolidase
MAAGPTLPADADGAKSRLDASPRHGEWVDIKNGTDSIRSWLVYPERAQDAPVVIVIHEIFGLTDWIRGVADQFAADGFIAIAPDLLSGKGPNGGNTDSVDQQGAVALVRGLDDAEVVRRLNAVAKHATSRPAATQKFGVVGFCWGGRTSFLYATAQPELDAAVVYYGTSPNKAAIAEIESPVLGLYGENDARVNATIPEAEAEMKSQGKAYEKEIYAGAGHGFLRQQDGQEGANMKATEKAWPSTIAFFKKHLAE